jgi:ankyrin repeat protein
MSRAALRLLDAVRKGRESDVKEMLESSTWGGDGGDGGGGGAEEEEQVRDAALLWAAMLGHVRVMQDLSRSGADVRATDSHGYTPLIWAARGHTHNHALVVRILLSGGRSDKEARDHHAGWTPLLHAVASGNLETVEALMR